MGHFCGCQGVTKLRRCCPRRSVGTVQLRTDHCLMLVSPVPPSGPASFLSTPQTRLGPPLHPQLLLPRPQTRLALASEAHSHCSTASWPRTVKWPKGPSKPLCSRRRTDDKSLCVLNRLLLPPRSLMKKCFNSIGWLTLVPR